MRGISFIYDGVPSEEYGLGLVYLGNDDDLYPSGSGVDIVTDRAIRNAQEIMLSAEETPVLEFEFCAVSEEPLDGATVSKAKQWLFGPLSFRRLQVCLDDFRHLYFNCVLTADGDYAYMGGVYGFKVKAVCDAPFAWEFPRFISGTVSSADDHVDFYNTSADSEDLMPILRFNMAESGSFSISNLSYEGRTFMFSDLDAGEEITVDNRLGIITSSAGHGRLAKFNKRFIRLKPGYNHLVVSAPIGTYYEIEYTNAVRMGGALC